MSTFDLPEGVRRTLHEQLRDHGWLDAATSGRDKLKVAAAVATLAAIVLATATRYVTSIVEESDPSLPQRPELS